MARAFITTYLTRPKMERHPEKDWPIEFRKVDKLARTVAPHGELIIAADQLTMRHVPRALRSTVSIWPVTQLVENIYFERWDIVRDILTARTDLTHAYACDARDVYVMSDPWGYMQPDTLYTCQEPPGLPELRRWKGQPLGRSGFINDTNYHHSPVIQDFIRNHHHHTALNAGVAGGDRATMLRLATRLAEERHAEHVKDDYTDMALFNYLAYSEFNVIASEDYIGAKCHDETQAPNAKVIHGR